jgi:hypothetical protein
MSFPGGHSHADCDGARKGGETLDMFGEFNACFRGTIQPDLVAVHGKAIYNDSMDAKETLRLYWDGKTFPVPVVRIANAMGARVVSSLDMTDSGQVERIGEGYKITVREGEPDYRRRFTIAHELGHIALGHLGSAPLFRDSHFNRPRNYREQAANRFAAAFLMPAEFVELAWGKIGYRKIAEYFGVSVQTLVYRLVQLGIVDDE